MPHSPRLRSQVDAIVFLVDAVDKERFPESKKELDGLLSDDSLATVPFMVLGNKIDIPHAASEVRARLGWLALARKARPLLQLCGRPLHAWRRGCPAVQLRSFRSQAAHRAQSYGCCFHARMC